jgi:SAM-dependent methyltransferase
MGGSFPRKPGSTPWASGETGGGSTCSILSCTAASRQAGLHAPWTLVAAKAVFAECSRQPAWPRPGIDPTPRLVEAARWRDPSGDYRLGRAERLEFEPASFDLVVSYLTLVDIADFRMAISEMARVLKPGGSLLIANLTGFTSACAAQGWVRDEAGRRLHFPVDQYLDEFSFWFEWAGIRIENWHRPLAAYMAALLESGLHLTFFSEPEPVSGEASRREDYRRAPWFVVMEWRRPSTR